MSGEALPDLLLQNIDEPIQINLEDASQLKWGKSLRNMPLFTIKEIEMHRQESGKDHGGPILKTLERGRKFKDERYISADSIFTVIQGDLFYSKQLAKLA